MTGWRLGGAAQLYRRVGWPVVAGAWWSSRSHRFVCSVDACRTAGPHPLVADAGGLHTVDMAALPASMLTSAAARRRWPRRSAVILPTGVVCDVIDSPTGVGRRLAGALARAGQVAPVAVVGERWLLFVAPGIGNDTGAVEAAAGLGALVHSWGSWVMLPPSRTGDRLRCHWVRPPWSTGWCMPAFGAIRDAIGGLRAAADGRFRPDSGGAVVGHGRSGPADLAVHHHLGS
jgi:Bifunctional DNA primase/polymerase, N-terminal